MNYTEIISHSKAYADRESDPKLDNTRMDLFLKMIESRVNRKLDTLEMDTVDDTACVTDQIEYSLPTDFGSIRSLKLVDSLGDETTEIAYLAPELIHAVPSDSEGIFYTTLSGNIRLNPPQDTGNTLRLYYYQHVPALTSTETTNWLGDGYPDVYIFGLMTEISAFVKNAEAVTLWDARFKEALDEIIIDDSSRRYSGPSPVIQVIQ